MTYRGEGTTADGQSVTLYVSVPSNVHDQALAMFRSSCEGEGWELVSARVYSQTGEKVLARWEKKPGQ